MRLATDLVQFQIIADANRPGDRVGLRVLARLVPGQLPGLDQRRHDGMIGGQHLDLALTQAIKPTVARPQRAKMAIGQHQRHHRRAHGGLPGRGLLHDGPVGGLQGLTDLAELFSRGHVVGQHGDAVDHDAAGKVAALVAAHAVRHHPDLLVGQDEDGIFIDLADTAHMGLGVEPDRALAHP